MAKEENIKKTLIGVEEGLASKVAIKFELCQMAMEQISSNSLE